MSTIINMPWVRLARWTLCMNRTVTHDQTLPSSAQRNQIINETFRQQVIFIRSVLKHLYSYSKDTRNIPSEPHRRKIAQPVVSIFGYTTTDRSRKSNASTSLFKKKVSCSMDSFLKPHTTSCTIKDCWVFSFWFQALERVNYCRQSVVMSQISFTCLYVPFVVHGCIEETLSTFFTYLTFKT